MSDELNCVIVLLCLTILLLVIILPLSISKSQYYEYSFSASRIYGTVDRSKVYHHGAYWIGPDKYFVSYPSVAVSDSLTGLSIWSKASATDAGTPLLADVTFQYQLVKEELSQLYAKVGFDFKPFVAGLAINAIKNTATNFSSDDYLMRRRLVEGYFFTAVQTSLAQNANARLFNLQLGRVNFSDSFYSVKLSAAIQDQLNAEEEFKQTAALTRGETVELVNQIQNNANQVLQLSQATSQLIVAKAQNAATKIQQDARNQGLLLLAKSLNITSQKHLISLDYLVSLEGTGSKAYAGFDQVIKTV